MLGIIFFLWQGGSVLLLTGPPGCGKTATIQILAKDLDIQVQEWTNPILLDFTKEDLRSTFGHGKYFDFFFLFLPYTSVIFIVWSDFVCDRGIRIKNTMSI